MIIDFNRVDSFDGRHYDFCIAGAGAAGITLALELAKKGKKVALFEGGDRDYTSQSQQLYAGEVTGENSYWLELLRLRFLGGTTNHWAGRCRPFTEFDFINKQINGLPGWPIAFDEMNQYLDRAIQILELDAENTFKSGDGITIRSKYFEPDIQAHSKVRFRERYAEEIEQNKNIDLFLNANLVDIKLNDNLQTIESFTIRNYQLFKASFTAADYILAMGAIENARILLNANAQLKSGIGNNSDMVGKCFMEHFNVRMGEFIANTGKWGDSTGMQFFTTAHFAEKYNTGLSNITFGTVNQIKAYGRTAELKAMFNRLSCRVGLSDHMQFLYKHDCIGEGIITSLCEQFPNKKSQITLTDQQDSFGLNRIKLDWQLSEADTHSIRTSAIAAAEEFAKNNFGRVKLSSFIINESEKIEVSHHAHQMGTTRMALSEKHGVVDTNSKVFGTSNLYIAGASVFPTGGGGNPTMPLLQLTFRLADHLIKKI